MTILLNVSCEGTVTPTINTTGIDTITTSTTPTTPTTPTTSTTTEMTATETIEDISGYYTAYITVMPETATITAGESQLFTVMGYDYEGNSYEVTKDCDYLIPKDAGGTWIGNEYISENPGTWLVRVRYWNPVDGTEFWRADATLIVEEPTGTPQTS